MGPILGLGTLETHVIKRSLIGNNQRDLGELSSK